MWYGNNTVDSDRTKYSKFELNGSSWVQVLGNSLFTFYPNAGFTGDPEQRIFVSRTDVYVLNTLYPRAIVRPRVLFKGTGSQLLCELDGRALDVNNRMAIELASTGPEMPGVPVYGNSYSVNTDALNEGDSLNVQCNFYNPFDHDVYDYPNQGQGAYYSSAAEDTYTVFRDDLRVLSAGVIPILL